MTRTYATVTVCDATFDEIYTALANAQYNHCLSPGKIVMDGLALLRKAKEPVVGMRTQAALDALKRIEEGTGINTDNLHRLIREIELERKV